MKSDATIAAIEARFEYWRPRLGLWLGPILGLTAFALASGTSLPPAAQRLVGVLVFTFTYWLSEPIPLAATAMLGPLLCVVCGVEDLKKVFPPFAAPIIFLFIGSFLLAAATRKHGLDQRLALKLLSRPGVAQTPTRLLIATAAVTGFLSMWMSNAATTALVLPVVLGLIETHPELGKPRVAASLLLMISFAATAGGLATPVGTPPNLIALGLVRQLTGLDVSFVQWMLVAVPLSVVLIVILILLLQPRGTGRLADHDAFIAGLRAKAGALGPWTAGERNVVVVFCLALGAWLYPGLAELIAGKSAPGVAWFDRHLPEEIVGLCAGLLLFLLPTDRQKFEFTINWRDGAQIDWGTILLFGGGMALGQLIFSTGLAKSIGDVMMGWLGSPGLWLLMAAGVVLSVALSEFTSNTATANVVVPLMIGLAQASHLNPIPIAIATCLACSFGFMLPVSTGPNAMVYGTGRVPLRRMLTTGLLFDGIGIAAILAAMWLAVRCGIW